MTDTAPETGPEGHPLRRGWTTGACATAATKAALGGLLDNIFPDPVTIRLPGGQTPSFVLAHEAQGGGWAEAGVIKDAGDDPDVTHGALIMARVAPARAGSGVGFAAGAGVGTVTKPGLPVAVGEPAINPVPRRMMREVVEAAAAHAGVPPDFLVTVSVRDGAEIAKHTWNPRLGIVGGLSILGTTGIVVPYSCSAWIHSIHRGVDVARAMGLSHIVGATGDVSERAAMARLRLPLESYIDMGDFAGGLLKYVRVHPVERLTIAGGFGKLTKLAQGALDLHSARSQVELHFLAQMLQELGAGVGTLAEAQSAGTAAGVLQVACAAGLPLADRIARRAAEAAQRVAGPDVRIGVLVVDREGAIVGESG